MGKLLDELEKQATLAKKQNEEMEEKLSKIEKYRDDLESISHKENKKNKNFVLPNNTTKH